MTPGKQGSLGQEGLWEALSVPFFLPPHQDWQRDRPSLSHQGPEEGRFLPAEGPVQPPPQEQPQRKAVRDGLMGSCLGEPEGSFSLPSSRSLSVSHPFLTLPFFVSPPQREMMWVGGLLSHFSRENHIRWPTGYPMG